MNREPGVDESKIGEGPSQALEVQVAGLPLRLRSVRDSEKVKELARMVDERVNAVMASQPHVSYQKALALAALHLAEDLSSLRSKALEKVEKLESSAKALLTSLESSQITKIRLDN